MLFSDLKTTRKQGVPLVIIGMKHRACACVRACVRACGVNIDPLYLLQVVRAFSHLEWNDPRIIRSLREREKGEGTLAK